jgi:hypothetical protein
LKKIALLAPLIAVRLAVCGPAAAIDDSITYPLSADGQVILMKRGFNPSAL